MRPHDLAIRVIFPRKGVMSSERRPPAERGADEPGDDDRSIARDVNRPHIDDPWSGSIARRELPRPSDVTGSAIFADKAVVVARSALPWEDPRRITHDD